MTPERLAEIQQRVDAATPGEWFWNSYSTVFSSAFTEAHENSPGYPETPRPGPPFFTPEDHAWLAQRNAAYEADSIVAGVPAHYGDTATGRHAADAEFIAHARQDVPDLLAALAAATEREQAYRAALGMAERNTRERWGGALGSFCRICDQRARDGGPIDHAPDCPFAVLAAGGPADGRGEG